MIIFKYLKTLNKFEEQKMLLYNIKLINFKINYYKLTIYYSI